MRRGFTLIELVIVLTVTGILSAVTVMSLHIAGERESVAAERLAADLRYAQTWAMTTHNRTWVVFDTSNSRYTVYVEDPANPGKAGRYAMTNPLTLAAYQVTFGDDETAGVALLEADFDGSAEVEFDSDGLAYDGDANPLSTNGYAKVSARRVTVSPAGWVGVS